MIVTPNSTMEASNRVFCTKCNAFRPANDFQENRQGKQRKICVRHPTKKRALDVFDAWDDFIEKIRSWNKPVCEYSMEFLSP